MYFLRGMLSETNGTPSLMRGLTAVVVFAVVGMWVYVSARKNELQPMSPEMVFMVASALGMKVWQRGKEGGTDSSSQTEFLTRQTVTQQQPTK